MILVEYAIALAVAFLSSLYAIKIETINPTIQDFSIILLSLTSVTYCYLFPTVIAVRTGKIHYLQIFLFNLLSGWTIGGLWISLACAMDTNPHKKLL